MMWQTLVCHLSALLLSWSLKLADLRSVLKVIFLKWFAHDYPFCTINVVHYDMAEILGTAYEHYQYSNCALRLW